MKFSWKIFLLLFFAPIFYLLIIFNKESAKDILINLFKPSIDAIDKQAEDDSDAYKYMFDLLKGSLLNI